MYTCGSVVHLVDPSGKPCARSIVAHAGMDEDTGLPVVILRDNTMWEGVVGGKSWKHRNNRWYKGRLIYPYDKERDDKLELELIRARLNVVLSRLDDLPEDARTRLGRFMRKLTSALEGN